MRRQKRDSGNPPSVLQIVQFVVHKLVISNSKWTEWSTIQGVIVQVISKADDREERGGFGVMSKITP